MDQLLDFADDRLINGCIYCGGAAETRDHVPSRIILDYPFPENLPVVGACKRCNHSFSKDEQYFVCFLQSVLDGTTNPKEIKRPSIARAMERSPALRARIEATKVLNQGRFIFYPEEERIKNVMLKLARGHAAFELSQLCKDEPEHFWCGPLEALSQEQRDTFDAVHIQQLFGEVGSRNMQRMYVVEAKLQNRSGNRDKLQLIVNDWVEVQEGYYRYLAVDDVGGIIIRIVISEYLACEVGWNRYS